MTEVDFQYLSVGFIVYMGIHWVAEVCYSFYTEFSK